MHVHSTYTVPFIVAWITVIRIPGSPATQSPCTSDSACKNEELMCDLDDSKCRIKPTYNCLKDEECAYNGVCDESAWEKKHRPKCKIKPDHVCYGDGLCAVQEFDDVPKLGFKESPTCKLRLGYRCTSNKECQSGECARGPDGYNVCLLGSMGDCSGEKKDFCSSSTMCYSQKVRTKTFYRCRFRFGYKCTDHEECPFGVCARIIYANGTAMHECRRKVGGECFETSDCTQDAMCGEPNWLREKLSVCKLMKEYPCKKSWMCQSGYCGLAKGMTDRKCMDRPFNYEVLYLSIGTWLACLSTYGLIFRFLIDNK